MMDLHAGALPAGQLNDAAHVPADRVLVCASTFSACSHTLVRTRTRKTHSSALAQPGVDTAWPVVGTFFHRAECAQLEYCVKHDDVEERRLLPNPLRPSDILASDLLRGRVAAFLDGT
jgi:hypothetical protein